MILNDSFFERFGVEYSTNQIIFCEFEPGNDFFFLQSGKVKIVKLINNREKIIDVLEEGDVFGEMSILEQEPRSATALASTPVKVLKFHRDNFDTLLKGNPQLAYKLLVIFSKRIYDAKRRLSILLLDEPQLKVMDVFNMLSEQDPQLDYQSSITLEVTSQDIANWSGMLENDVQKVLTRLLQLDKIELYADKVVVKNINSFQRTVASSRKKKSYT